MYHGVNSIYVRKTPRLSLSKTPDLVRSSHGENFARTTFKRFGAKVLYDSFRYVRWWDLLDRSRPTASVGPPIRVLQSPIEVGPTCDPGIGHRETSQFLHRVSPRQPKNMLTTSHIPRGSTFSDTTWAQFGSSYRSIRVTFPFAPRFHSRKQIGIAIHQLFIPVSHNVSFWEPRREWGGRRGNGMPVSWNSQKLCTYRLPLQSTMRVSVRHPLWIRKLPVLLVEPGPPCP